VQAGACPDVEAEAITGAEEIDERRADGPVA
jgi:hypothetical protein